MPGRARHHEREHEERPENPARYVAPEKAGRRSGETDREEPVLNVEGHDIGASHRVECSSVDDRNQRRVGRSVELHEELLVESTEGVDRDRLRHPERPGVERVEALQS